MSLVFCVAYFLPFSFQLASNFAVFGQFLYESCWMPWIERERERERENFEGGNDFELHTHFSGLIFLLGYEQKRLWERMFTAALRIPIDDALTVGEEEMIVVCLLMLSSHANGLVMFSTPAIHPHSLTTIYLLYRAPWISFSCLFTCLSNLFAGWCAKPVILSTPVKLTWVLVNQHSAADVSKVWETHTRVLAFNRKMEPLLGRGRTSSKEDTSTKPDDFEAKR